MSVDWLRQNWGLAAAVVLIALVLVITSHAVYRRSAGGQLAAAARRLRLARREHAKAAARVAGMEARVQKLAAKSQSVKPRVLTEAREALQDARALAKISHDKVLIAANHVRKVIYQEYPPARHDALRRKYLPDDKPDGKPFTF